ncbi:hypothetical protein PR002_g22139 [Phytophthora rubi]|uniref:CCHC-type domain-containing protein n=1 Tax=Phytophthora rubi TaxID=129364 RepID=A0A6A3IVP0_9STRA|nr:hypothetical protein PR002_g22139 [Phytophthora rubi]
MAPRTVRSQSAAPLTSIALTHAVSNAVKVLPLFHSAGVTVEKARDFWEAFEDTTRDLPDRSRLLVFHQKIKGSEAERWCNNSSIKTFETLKIRFHNHFLSRTADELWERLHSTKRARGESIEEWGDRVSDLCDSLDYPDPKMRYQLFWRGLSNRRKQAILDSSPACDIPEACEWLMAKDMYRPAEEDEDFDDGTPAKNGSHSEKSSLLLPVLDQVNALAQEVRTFVKSEKEWRNKVNNQLQVPHQNPYQAPSTVAAIPPPVPPVRPNPQQQQGNGRQFRAIRMEEDSRAQDGAPICGCCHFLGHGRETCRRRSMTCRRCNQFGHVVAECEQPSGSGYYASEKRHCAFCDDNSYSTNQCPAIARLQEEEGRAALSSGPKNGSEGDRGRVPVGKRVEVSVLREVVKRESESRTESKSAKAAQRTVLPPRETRSKKETRTVDVGKTVGAGVEVKKTVERVVVQEGVIGKEVNEEPRTEETAVPVEETVVPEEAVNKVTVGVESAVVENDAAQEEKAEEPVLETPVPNGTDESSSVESMGASTEEMKQKEYQRLFTDEELDAMEVSSPGQEGTELEDRLFPLDEVELLKRMKKNAEAQKDPSLEDMAKHLNLPVEVLERTKEASPDEMSSPEYWQEWFQSTLESSEEAKRANRDFKAFGPRSMQDVPGAAEVVYEDFGMFGM